MSGFKKKIDRYQARRLSAASQSLEVLRPALGIEFDIQRIGPAALRALGQQWAPAPRGADVDHWDWEEIVRAYSDPEDWALSLWAGERLAALAVAAVRGSVLYFDYLEGHPRPDCPLKPQRFAIVLDAFIRYARLCGVREIRIEPLNEALASRYQTVYKFKPCPSEGASACLRLEL